MGLRKLKTPSNSFLCTSFLRLLQQECRKLLKMAIFFAGNIPERNNQAKKMVKAIPIKILICS